MKKYAGFLFIVSLASGFEYAESDTLVALSQGGGEFQIGICFEDVPLGPYRLVSSDSLLYLLDQLNSRVLCFDTSGRYKSEIKTAFKPWDIAVDDSGKLYLLDNRTQPATISLYEDETEVERIRVAYDVKQPLTAIVSHPPDSLLVLSGMSFFCVEKSGLHGENPNSAVLKELDPDSIAGIEVSGIRFLGLPHPPEGRVQEHLLAYGSGRVWIGKETMIQDKSGSFYLRSVYSLSDSDEEPAFISMPLNFYGYDTGWRNVAIDQFGNVYAFTSTEDGKAAILRWRAVY